MTSLFQRCAHKCSNCCFPSLFSSDFHCRNQTSGTVHACQCWGLGVCCHSKEGWARYSTSSIIHVISVILCLCCCPSSELCAARMGFNMLIVKYLLNPVANSCSLAFCTSFTLILWHLSFQYLSRRVLVFAFEACTAWIWSRRCRSSFSSAHQGTGCTAEVGYECWRLFSHVRQYYHKLTCPIHSIPRYFLMGFCLQ